MISDKFLNKLSKVSQYVTTNFVITGCHITYKQLARIIMMFSHIEMIYFKDMLLKGKYKIWYFENIGKVNQFKLNKNWRGSLKNIILKVPSITPKVKNMLDTIEEVEGIAGPLDEFEIRINSPFPHMPLCTNQNYSFKVKT